jgi:hypothetical protein
MFRKTIGWLAFCAIVAQGTAWAGGDRAEAAEAAGACGRVSGKAIWSLIPSPNDPFGRVLGPATGVARRGFGLTSLAPQPDGSLRATSVETWALSSSDSSSSGVASFAATESADYNRLRRAFADRRRRIGPLRGATGSLTVTGMGYNIFGPAAAPATASSK